MIRVMGLVIMSTMVGLFMVVVFLALFHVLVLLVVRDFGFFLFVVISKNCK